MKHTVFTGIEHFFFHREAATGWGMMRAAWGTVAALFLLGQWNDVWRFYSDAGLLTPELQPLVLRQQDIFSVLFFLSSPGQVFALYLTLMVSCILMALGILPRLTTIISVLLLFSFHERNPLLLSGGDTVLRLTGFLLMIAPGIQAFSLKRLRQQRDEWRRNRTLLPPLTMPVWPRLLLLWQLIVLYFTAAWDKLQGPTWLSGAAPDIALHHLHFSRLPLWMIDALAPLSPVVALITLVYEFIWIALLLPPIVAREMPWHSGNRLKRWLILCGFIFHGVIFLLMDVGSFSLAMFTLFLGLLNTEDFDAMRRVFNRGYTYVRSIAVLYDGHCRLCRRSMFTFAILDWLHRLKPVDYHLQTQRELIAPDVPYQDLNRLLHIRFRHGRHFDKGSRTLTGFDAFRALAWHLPPLWLLAPLMSLPGVGLIGWPLYRLYVDPRLRCTHENCQL